MSYTSVHYEDLEPVAGGMHFLRDPLDCEALGVTVIDCPAGWTGKAHDHADGGQEEVYLVVDGQATLEVGGDAVTLSAGDAVHVEPGAERQLRNGDGDTKIVVAGAP